MNNWDIGNKYIDFSGKIFFLRNVSGYLNGKTSSYYDIGFLLAELRKPIS